ncbi:TetR/AcrR family transcriptional regulator [Streptomyces sp. NPDC051636]|uniref:TetR/AcrR family transcriptional regulator n=1 Tax=Streptomyces sp. NPDC051636 TaxID=3365663 RepID=UPI0037B5FFE3
MPGGSRAARLSTRVARCSRTRGPPKRAAASAPERESQRPRGVRIPTSPCQAAGSQARVLALEEMPDPRGGLDVLADALALAAHRSVTGNRDLLVARYELALEATRRPELRAFYNATGAVFRDQLAALLTAAVSADPARHVLSLVAWADGLMFSCVAGSFSAEVPSLPEVRAGVRELLRGMLGG